MSATFYYDPLLALITSQPTICQLPSARIGRWIVFLSLTIISFYVFLLTLGVKSREVKHYLTDVWILRTHEDHRRWRMNTAQGLVPELQPRLIHLQAWMMMGPCQ